MHRLWEENGGITVLVVCVFEVEDEEMAVFCIVQVMWMEKEEEGRVAPGLWTVLCRSVCPLVVQWEKERRGF